MVTHADLVDYHRLNYLTNEKGQHTRLVADAALAAGLTPVTIAGPVAQARAGLRSAGPAGHRSGLGRPGGAGPGVGRGAADRNRVTLLSPFDSLIWDRKRTRQMFGFEHSLEAYVPKHKRVHGYFTMPLLAGGDLAGRVDPAREGKTLIARKVSLERAAAAEPMAQALREAARWVGCDDVRLEQIEPAQVRPAAHGRCWPRPKCAVRLWTRSSGRLRRRGVTREELTRTRSASAGRRSSPLPSGSGSGASPGCS